ncbi:hypothetical protein PIB30_045889 [Stylosanthes scabra]|uniref:F-box associated beta-propeller type 1 domain-containing protein n=1 Tax=Stylosanthes scabra TaxID=79078 RepID=A0ABU6TG01_9FABA|nr:hypothetical protein [Stylosanthes scabra]
MLKSRKFIIENYHANAKRQADAIVGVGFFPPSFNSQWLYRIDTQAQGSVPFDIPRMISPFGQYTVIGSDHGNICLRVTENGLNSRIMVWNPLTRDYMWIHDDPWARRDFPVNVMAYGYLKDGLDYRIVNVWRRTFGHGSLFWSVYDSEVEKWTLERSYNTEIQKIGPQSVVSDGIVFWIAWDGLRSGVPTCIVTFNLRWMEFHHGDIPVEASTENNALKKSWVELPSSHIVTSAIPVRSWCGAFIMRGTIRLYCKSSYGPANNNQRSDLFLYILRHMRGAAELFYHNFWEEDVQLKTVTLHSDGLYPVRKDPPYTLE